MSWTRKLIAASASLCLVFGLILVTPFPNGNSPLATYIDSLDDEQGWHYYEIRAVFFRKLHSLKGFNNTKWRTKYNLKYL